MKKERRKRKENTEVVRDKRKRESFPLDGITFKFSKNERGRYNGEMVE